MAHKALGFIASATTILSETREALRHNQGTIETNLLEIETEKLLTENNRNRMSDILTEESSSYSQKIKTVTDLILTLQDVTEDLERDVEGRCVKGNIKLVIQAVPELKLKNEKALLENLRNAGNEIKLKP